MGVVTHPATSVSVPSLDRTARKLVSEAPLPSLSGGFST
ncbi:hypothetical protein AKJ09_10103 [Labilithrix luteola]|uniref:Uncharacterized protein n=1 Tax=Labilithrix luteola TaxID=1391654 RepID=A0A0K1QDD0_9BACT|nr:hypothetical protein AKJ09_10103 [Labilithrix luteola]